jgi:hypothetical protein
VRAFNALESLWNVLEAGLLIRKLEEAGEAGRAVLVGEVKAAKAIDEAMAVYKENLYILFTLMYGDHPEVITSEDLLQAGFDDTREPKIEDYHDYI